MSAIAIIAALPGELGPLVKGWKAERRGGVRLWRGRLGERECAAACAGMGAAAAARAWEALASAGPFERVISVGWAGALHPEFIPGRAYRAAGAIDAATGRRFPSAAPGRGWVVSVARVAGREEKRRLAASHGAALVDMEAAELGRLAADAGAAFACVKGVSDAWDADLPDLNRFISRSGGLRWSRLLAWVLPRPVHWAGLARMGRHGRASAVGIARLLSGAPGAGD